MPDCAIFSNTRAVLFDAGGTIIVSRPTLEEMLVTACHASGIDLSGERAARICAVARDRFRTEVVGAELEGRKLSTSETQSIWQDAFRGTFDAAFPQQANPSERVEVALARIPFGWSSAEGAKSVLRAIRKSGRLVGVVSNFDARLPQVLAEVGLRGDIDAVIASAVVGSEKPHPGIFEAALKQLGVGAKEAVHVGDDALDIVGATAAGIMSVWLNASGEAWKPPSGSRAEPKAVIRRLADLPPLLGIATE
jgi:putative hydrolase of the HAD superfamily